MAVFSRNRQQDLIKTTNYADIQALLSDYEDATFYSGYCIKYPGDYNSLLEQLNSERMQKFVEVSCRDFRGGWKAYNKKTLENFVLED